MLKHISIKTFIVCAAIAGVFALSATATRASEPIAAENISAILNSVENIDALLEEAKANPGKPISSVISSETKTFINGEEVAPSMVRIPEGDGKVIHSSKTVRVTGSDGYDETELEAKVSMLTKEMPTAIGQPIVKVTNIEVIEEPVEDPIRPGTCTTIVISETTTISTNSDGSTTTTIKKDTTITIEENPKVSDGNGNPIGIKEWDIRFEYMQADYISAENATALITPVYNKKGEYIGNIVDKKYRDYYPDAIGYMVTKNSSYEIKNESGSKAEALHKAIIAANTPKLTVTSNGDHAVLEFDNKEGATMQFDVVDMNGNIVKTITAQGNSFTVSGLASGIYFVKSKENPNMQTKIVIAQ